MGRVAVALVLGLIVGIGVARIGNPTLSRGLALLEPVGAIWVNGIRMTVVPLVIALLLGAVARGSEARVGRLGGLAFGTFVALHVVVAVVALALVPALMSRLPARFSGGLPAWPFCHARCDRAAPSPAQCRPA